MGIDPGKRTGVAVVERQRLLFCSQFPKDTLFAQLDVIIRDMKITKAAVERSRYAVLYNRPWLDGASRAPLHRFAGGRIGADDYRALMDKAKGATNHTAGQIKLAQNVGQNIEWANRIVGYLEGKGLKVGVVAPKAGRTKWKAEMWARVFKWEGRIPGMDARDAALIAFFNEGKV